MAQSHLIRKLSPRFVGPFDILERIGIVAYRLVLPPSLAGVHDVFYVSMLKKYVHGPSHILEVALITLPKYMLYVEQPLRIVDQKLQVLRKRTVPYSGPTIRRGKKLGNRKKM